MTCDRLITRLVNRLPERFKWTPHNLVAHPLSEVLYQISVSIENVGNRIHDATVPTHESGTGRG
jgi:hypothetical protein